MKMLTLLKLHFDSKEIYVWWISSLTGHILSSGVEFTFPARGLCYQLNYFIELLRRIIDLDLEQCCLNFFVSQYDLSVTTKTTHNICYIKFSKKFGD